jgi:hypothetical protein
LDRASKPSERTEARREKTEIALQRDMEERMKHTHEQKPSARKHPEAERPSPNTGSAQSRAASERKPSTIERSEWRGEGVCGDFHTD